MRIKKYIRAFVAAVFFASAPFEAAIAGSVELLNVSYDPTREFYEQYNKLFAEHFKEKTGQDIKINMSHGGSAKQARSVIEGLRADVATLALAYDIDVIAKKGGLISADWQNKYPHNSAPSASVIVFLVREGNPKNIRDWDDLIKDDVKIITPNPKTGGGARWNYLAAWGYAEEKFAGDKNKIENFMREIFKRVPVLDAGARGASTTFVHRGIGDVLIAWESEAFLSKREMKDKNFEIIYPSVSIKAEPPVAVVTKYTERKKTTQAAEEYISFLYSKRAQELAAENFYRPVDEEIAAKYSDKFPPLKKMLNIEDFGGWQKSQQDHFSDDGSFDRIYGG